MDIVSRRPRRPAASGLAALVAALAVAAGCSAAAPRAAPPPPPPTTAAVAEYLQGRPLDGATGLRLLLASDPPRLLDVDRGISQRVVGVPAGQGPFSVSPVGDGAIVAADREVFVLRRGSGRATPVGRGGNAMASLDGRGVWLLQQGTTCGLREVFLDGRARRPLRKLPCSAGLLAETPRGLLVWTEPAADGEKSALLDPGTGRMVARYPEVLGVVGDLVLWGDQERGAGPFTLTNRRTGARHRVQRPTPHGLAGLGQASPDGRLLAVEFVDLSWTRVQGQVDDIWLLDLRTRRWRHLPGTPLITGVKFMSMQWTADGRLVLAGDFERFGEAMALWRPGQDHLAIRRLDLPDYAGSDTFVAFPASGS
jgi:hypothetical protein